MLALYHVKFTKALEYLAGRQEWGVKGYYDKNLLAHHVEETDESILSLKAEGSGKSSGLAYFTKKKLAEAKQAVAGRKEEEQKKSSTVSLPPPLAALRLAVPA